MALLWCGPSKNRKNNIVLGEGARGECFQETENLVLLPSVSAFLSLIVEISLALMRTQLCLCSSLVDTCNRCSLTCLRIHPDLTVSTLYSINGILLSAWWVSLKAESRNIRFKRPFPSSPQPPFQSEAKCEVCYKNQLSFILKMELITVTKISHLDSLGKRD